MGSADVCTKNYVSQNDVFADAFNYLLFDGEQVIMPDDLIEQDTLELAIVDKMKEIITDQKMRDVLKLCSIKKSKLGTLVLLGVEGQKHVHYAMPVRNYLYDALNYSDQVEKIRVKHKKAKDLKGNEFLSGFSKKDKILPVITLCICFDKKKWDAPKSIYEMLTDTDPRILNYVNDYKLNLITPADVDDFKKFSSELGLVLEVIHNSNDKDKLYAIMNSDERYRNVDVRTVEMINLYTSSDFAIDKEEGGQIDMCKAIEDMKAEARGEGAEMFARLIKAIGPDDDDYTKALNATEEEREALYKKYNII